MKKELLLILCLTLSGCDNLKSPLWPGGFLDFSGNNDPHVIAIRQQEAQQQQEQDERNAEGKARYEATMSKIYQIKVGEPFQDASELWKEYATPTVQTIATANGTEYIFDYNEGEYSKHYVYYVINNIIIQIYTY